MDVALEVSGGAALLSFTGRLTASNAAACCAALREAQAAAPVVALAFRAIEAVDLSFLQLLCAAHRSAGAEGGALTFSGTVPEGLVALAERAGAERCVGGPAGCSLRELRRVAGSAP